MRNLKDTVALINLTTLLFFQGSSYHIETSSLICFANQWTGFYMMGPFVMKELRHCTMGRKIVDLNTLEKN